MLAIIFRALLSRVKKTTVYFTAGQTSGRSTFFLPFLVKKVSKIIKGKILGSLTGFLTGKTAFMRIGYARVSMQEQNLNLQKDALKKAGCEKIVVDVASGKSEVRAGLEKLREVMRKGDVVVVWRLDRLGRSLRHLIEVMTERSLSSSAI